MNELALFAGAGGGILGGKILGWRTVCAVELDAHAREVLAARQNDGCLEPFPIWDDVRTFDGRPWRGVVDVVSGGFPCQDISSAGEGAGIDGARSGLWHEFARIVREVGPRFVLVENSPMLVGRGLGTVLGDLAALGYHAEWCVLGAIDAGAPHRRQRIWILAYTASGRFALAGIVRQVGGVAGSQRGDTGVADTNGERQLQPHGSEREIAERPGDGGETVANAVGDGRREVPERFAGAGGEPVPAADLSEGQAARLGDAAGAGLQGARAIENRTHRKQGRGKSATPSWWAAEPAVGRVANGVANRVDRLRCLGNGQVPAVVALAWRTLTGR